MVVQAKTSPLMTLLVNTTCELARRFKAGLKEKPENKAIKNIFPTAAF
jgi:hypothetical protein